MGVGITLQGHAGRDTNKKDHVPHHIGPTWTTYSLTPPLPNPQSPIPGAQQDSTSWLLRVSLPRTLDSTEAFGELTKAIPDPDALEGCVCQQPACKRSQVRRNN